MRLGEPGDLDEWLGVERDQQRDPAVLQRNGVVVVYAADQREPVGLADRRRRGAHDRREPQPVRCCRMAQVALPRVGIGDCGASRARVRRAAPVFSSRPNTTTRCSGSARWADGTGSDP